MTIITKSIVFKWKLSFNENYQWTNENELFNIKTMRKINKTVNGYSVGMKILNISNKMIHFIGEYYKYPNSNKRFKLVEVIGYKYLFACGHWCTDSVFEDLVRCRTGVQNYLNPQLELF